MLKKIIQKFIIIPLTALSYIYVGYEKLIRRIFPQLHGIVRQVLIDLIDSDKNQVRHENTKFWLYTPNKICNFRHSTFSTKEPEMLEWIEEYGGANPADIAERSGHVGVTIVRLARAEWQRAVPLLKRAISQVDQHSLISQADIEVLYCSAYVHGKAGLRDEAMHLLQRVLQVDPGHEDAKQILQVMLLRRSSG